jgi:acyl transferase domain-containing protein
MGFWTRGVVKESQTLPAQHSRAGGSLQPISSEPAPLHRHWASARARLADLDVSNRLPEQTVVAVGLPIQPWQATVMAICAVRLEHSSLRSQFRQRKMQRVPALSWLEIRGNQSPTPPIGDPPPQKKPKKKLTKKNERDRKQSIYLYGNDWNGIGSGVRGLFMNPVQILRPNPNVCNQIRSQGRIGLLDRTTPRETQEAEPETKFAYSRNFRKKSMSVKKRMAPASSRKDSAAIQPAGLAEVGTGAPYVSRLYWKQKPRPWPAKSLNWLRKETGLRYGFAWERLLPIRKDRSVQISLSPLKPYRKSWSQWEKYSEQSPTASLHRLKESRL